MEKKENFAKTKWLKHLQDGSWEPEILISGIVIYGLFKIFPYVDELHLYLENYVSDFFSRGTVDDNILVLLKISISWLIFGFISHLILRSFWVAYIGLSYVYKKDLDFNYLKYNKLYLKTIAKQKPITFNIEKLESICSTIFSISILFFMNVLGLIFLIAVIGLGVFLWLELFPEKTDFTIFNNILQGVLIFSVIDYLTSGLLKRIPYLNKIYYPIYKVINILTLAPLYRKIYYTFITNHKKWKIFIFLALFISITVMSALTIRFGLGNGLSLRPNAYGDQVMSPQYYLDEADKNISNVLWMPSQKVDSQTLEVFVVHTPMFEDKIKSLCGFEQKIKREDADVDNIKTDCLSEFYKLKIDDITIKTTPFYTKSYKTKQDGLKYFIPVDSLARGQHNIKLYYNFYNKEKDTVYNRLQAKTAFYKAIPKGDAK